MSEDKEQLEAEFKHLAESIGKQIAAKIKAAEQALAEATELSNKFGIPFSTTLNDEGYPNVHVPESYEEKYVELDNQVVADILGIDKDDFENGQGWRKSTWCA